MPSRKIKQEPELIDSDEEAEDELYNDLGGFQVSRSLPRYDEQKYTLRQLMALLDSGGIDLDPVYQRGFVWNEERQIGIIDSLFQGYYVPGLIFNKRIQTVLGQRTETIVCIDGKQRLTSVKRFTEGLFPCNDRHGKKWWFRQTGDQPAKGRKYLPQAAQAELWKKLFLCYEYVGMTDDQEHELFERVQRGNPLTPAEKSQAKKGDWQTLARTFQQDFLRVSNLSDNKRGAGHDKFISSFAQIIEGRKAAAEHKQAAFKGTSYWVEKLFVASINENPCTAEQKDTMKKVFDRFDELARLNPAAFANDGPHSKASFAPIEFVAVAYMLDQYEQRDNSELEGAIRAMRRKVRAVHKDNVRRKQIVWDTLLESMQESLNSRGVITAEGDVDELQCEQNSLLKVVQDSLNPRSAKRSAPADAEEPNSRRRLSSWPDGEEIKYEQD